jgi:membrane-associated PAP2 superfamily phosphatase
MTKQMDGWKKLHDHNILYSPLRQLHQLLLFLLLLLVTLVQRLFNTTKGDNWLHPSIVDGGMDKWTDEKSFISS